MDIEKECMKLEKRTRGWFICIVLVELVMALWFSFPKLENMLNSYDVFQTVEYLNDQHAWYTQTVVDKVDTSKNEVVVHPFNREDLSFKVASYDASAYENGNTLDVFFKDEETPLCIRSEVEGRMEVFISDLVKVGAVAFGVIISLFVFSAMIDSIVSRFYMSLIDEDEGYEDDNYEGIVDNTNEDDSLEIIDLDTEDGMEKLRLSH